MDTEKSKAEICYEKLQTYRRKRYENNKDKMLQQSKDYFQQVIKANPEKYNEYKEKKRKEYYKRKENKLAQVATTNV
jgi:hypothetical protein